MIRDAKHWHHASSPCAIPNVSRHPRQMPSQRRDGRHAAHWAQRHPQRHEAHSIARPSKTTRRSMSRNAAPHRATHDIKHGCAPMRIRTGAPHHAAFANATAAYRATRRRVVPHRRARTAYSASGLTSGNVMVSRIVAPVRAMSRRSMPMPMPPAGGMPTPRASRKSSSMSQASSSPASASLA